MIFGGPGNKTALIGFLSEIIDPNLRIDKLDRKFEILNTMLTIINRTLS